MNNRTPFVYGPDGRFRFPLTFHLPGTEISYAYDVAPDPGGGFVVAAVGGSADMRGWAKSGLVLFDANGVQTKLVDTGGFRCVHVVVTTDGTIWTTGAEYGDKREVDNYRILRKYSHSGELLGSYLDRSTFPAGLAPGGTSGTALFAADDRLAMIANSGLNGTKRELLELDFSGNVLGRMRLEDPHFRMYALTSNGAFFAGPMGPSDTILQLNPVSGTTREVAAPGKPWLLQGADGANLLYRSVTPDGHLKIGSFAPWD